MSDVHLEGLDAHVLVLGHGELTDVVLGELSSVPFLVVTPDAAWADERGDRPVLVGDPSDAETLERARIGAARAVVVATDDDAADALALLTARDVNPEVTIVASATNRENVEKLRRAGADAVVSAATIGGHHLVETAFGRGDAEEVARQLVGESAEDGPVD